MRVRCSALSFWPWLAWLRRMFAARRRASLAQLLEDFGRPHSRCSDQQPDMDFLKLCERG